MLLYIFLLLDASGPIQVAATASSCGIECQASECFAGKCLFNAQDLDDGDQFPQDLSASGGLATMSALKQGTATASADSSGKSIDLMQFDGRQTVPGGGDVFSDEDAKTLRSSESFPNPATTAVANVVAPLTFSLPASSIAVIGGAGAHSQKLLELQAPLFRADLAFLSDEVQFTKQQIANERSRAASLTSENSRLRKQLTDWRGAGARVADRDAKAVDLLVKTGRKLNETAAGTIGSAGVAVSLLSNLAFANMVPDRSHSVMKLLVFSFLLLIAFFGLTQRELAIKQLNLPWRDIMCQFATCNRRCPRSSSLLRYLGVSSYAVEISEIHLGNVLVGAEVYVNLRLGPDQEFNTPLVEKSDGAVFKFTSAFVFQVGRNDKPLVLSVISKDNLVQDRLAYLEIPALELLMLAHEQGKSRREYFRFDLVSQAISSLRVSHEDEHQPYTAVRLRDVTESVLRQAPEASADEEHFASSTSNCYYSYGSATNGAAAAQGAVRKGSHKWGWLHCGPRNR